MLVSQATFTCVPNPCAIPKIEPLGSDCPRVQVAQLQDVRVALYISVYSNTHTHSTFIIFLRHICVALPEGTAGIRVDTWASKGVLYHDSVPMLVLAWYSTWTLAEANLYIYVCDLRRRIIKDWTLVAASFHGSLQLTLQTIC